MKISEITPAKEEFESALPAFIDPLNHTYTRMKDFFAYARDTLIADYGDIEITEEARLAELKNLLCLMAAKEALPHLDLVVTENGFAVVNGQELAPASSFRIENLREQLRKERDAKKDYFSFSLLETAWKDSEKAKNMVTGLFWCPMIARRHGLKKGESDAYRKEWLALTPEIYEAEGLAKTIISPELHAKLVEFERVGGAPPQYVIMLEQCRKFMACRIKGIRKSGYSENAERRILQQALECWKDELPEYKNSNTFFANNYARYENKANDPCFFF